MAYTTINKSTDYFNTVTYTGDGNATQAITNTFQTDFSWIKDRGVTAAHTLQDAVRGFDVTKKLSSNSNDAENNASGATWGNYGGVSAVGATSFTTSLGSNTPYQTNANGSNYVAWNWKANGAGSANTAGSVNSTVSVNTTAGFSVVKYVGDGAMTTTVGHGLGVVPKVILIKNLETATNWTMYHHSLGNTGQMYLDTTNSFTTDADTFKDTTPTSTLWTMSNSSKTNQGTKNHIAYCFAEKTGYSKFGSWQGNSNADGPFIFCGFKPSFVLWKNSETGESWGMVDNKRDVDNVVRQMNNANTSNAESTQTNIMDFVSNGFKIRWHDGNINGTNQKHIFMAFAEAPLVGTNNVPCTAR